MKKIIFLILTFFILSFIAIITYLNIYGYETNKFNDIISKKINNVNNNVSIDFIKIKLKLDLKEASFYFSTKTPKINYYNNDILINELKVYTKFKSMFSKKILINKIYLNSGEIKVKKIQEIFLNYKPSNFKSIIINNVTNGIIKSNIELFIDNNYELINYNLKGYAKKIDIELPEKFYIKRSSFNFFLTKKTGRIENLSGKINDIAFNEGKLNYSTDNDIEIKASVESRAKLNKKKISNLYSDFEKLSFIKDQINLDVKALHNLELVFDQTLKVKKYIYNLDGQLDNSTINLETKIDETILPNKINYIQIDKTKFLLNLNNNNKNSFLIEGLYKINKGKINKFTIKNKFSKIISNINLDFEFNELVKIPILNYEKNEKIIANINSDIILKKNIINIVNLDYRENQSMLSIKDLIISKKGYLNNFKSIKVQTDNNDLKILLGNELKIIGNKYDAKNLSKLLNEKKKSIYLNKINKKIIIKIDKIKTSFEKDLKNFNLHGKIDKGRFTKINSKGEFDKNNFLDISLSKDIISNKSFLEIFSDFPEPLLSEYSFFKGLSGGKLIFTSSYKDINSDSKLIIEDFKLINAPGFMKLLTLADLGGMADLLSGDGISFNKMEMNFSNNGKTLNLNDLYAIGPSISILLDGYVDSGSGLVSLRGTMVPARNLNKFLSKIPIVGKIIIPKEIGEGLFGVSFKMKGTPKNIKTTVNPIKTLTPRFIQKALEKKLNNF